MPSYLSQPRQHRHLRLYTSNWPVSRRRRQRSLSSQLPSGTYPGEVETVCGLLAHLGIYELPQYAHARNDLVVMSPIHTSMNLRRRLA